MKQIVVPVDFSPAAENALRFGGALAQKMNAGLLLMNIFELPVTMSDVPALTIPIDELKQGADKGLRRARTQLLRDYPTLSIETESRMGDLSRELETIAEERSPLAIVTGSHSASGLEELFFGNESLNVVRDSRIPVIVVPENWKGHESSRIALAVDQDTESFPAETIKSFIKLCGAELHLIHVQAGSSENARPEPGLLGPDAGYHVVRDEDFLHGIQRYVEENAIHMLMVVPHQHSFLERLGFRTHTAELMRKLTIPLICINEVKNGN